MSANFNEDPKCARCTDGESDTDRVTDRSRTPAFSANNAQVTALPLHRGTSRFAIAALVLSICGQMPLLPFLIVQTASLVCSLLAIKEIRQQRPHLKGTSMLIIALILTILWLFNTSWTSADLALIPKIKARNEQHLEQTLQVLRAAIVRFHTDTGMNPADLTDLTAPNEHALKVHIPKGTYHGPYLNAGDMSIDGTGIPVNPMKGDFSNLHKHWLYNRSTGQVQSAVKGVTVDGRYYRDL
jgi:hypothetical protein